MVDTLEVRGYSVPNVGKERNGDSYALDYIEHEKLFLAVVADGVSRQPCDWLASETTCKKLLETFRKSANLPDIRLRLTESIFQTNEHVIATEGNCRRMASTLSVVVCDVERDLLYYANIGDSRIYCLDNGKLKQLTKDDSTVSREKIYTNGGFRVVDKHTLTKVIGQERISVDVVEQSITLGQVIILATDGFYEARKASFNAIMEKFEEWENFGVGFKTIIDKLEILRGDDFTVVMIKKR